MEEIGEPPFLNLSYLTAIDGLIKLLKNEENTVKIYALKRLHDIVDIHAHDIVNYLSLIDEIGSDPEFPQRELAVLLIARVHFFNGNRQEALEAVLTIPQVFVNGVNTEFCEVLVGEMIDVLMTCAKFDCLTMNSEDRVTCEKSTASISHKYDIDKMYLMENIASKIIDDCGGSYNEKQAIGIALELRQLNLLKTIISRQADPKMLLRYLVSIVTRFFYASTFKEQVYVFVVDELFKQNPLDYATIFFCLIRTNQSKLIGETLLNLAINHEHNVDNCSIATQLCFDLHENAMPKMIDEILITIKRSDFYREGKKVTFDSSTKKKQKNPTDGPAYTSVVLESSSNLPPLTHIDNEFLNSEGFLSMTEGEKRTCLTQMNNEYKIAHLKYIYEKLTKFIIILRGKATTRLWFEYIIKTMKSDGHVLRLLRSCVKSSLSMTAIIFANALMHCGTTGDSFARENAEWFGRCSNWSKFAYVLGYGLIHSGNHTEGMKVLGSFLPRRVGGNSERKYEESGAICALGFIFGNRSTKVKDYIQTNFYAAQDPVIFHGCCLGFGLACFGNYDENLLNYLLVFLESPDPLKAFGASICYGLITIGIDRHFNFSFLKNILLETKHEKTKIGLSILLSCAYAQTGVKALPRINELLAEKRGACHLAAAYMIGLAFVGTGDIEAVRMLWKLVIFDVDEHVKRAAVISLAFVLLRDKPQFYDIMTQLFNSHHPMVRCASAFALGVVFAGTGHPDAYVLVSHLFMDVDVRVRQAAYISAAMLMMHLNETKTPSAKVVRENLIAVITISKSIDQLVRFGAILGIGIIDAGGKNLVINYFTSDGSVRIHSIIGMFLFAASYYWYPLIGFLTLAFVPSAIIAVKDDFSIPVIKLISNKPPAHLKYASFSHTSRRVSRNKTSLRLSAHRKSRKSKRSSFIMSIVSPHRTRGRDFPTDPNQRSVHSKSEKAESIASINTDQTNLDETSKNSDVQTIDSPQTSTIPSQPTSEIFPVIPSAVPSETRSEARSEDPSNAPLSGEKQKTKSEQNDEIEMISVDQDDGKSDHTLQLRKTVPKKAAPKPCIVKKNDGKSHKKKSSAEKVTFDLPESELHAPADKSTMIEVNMNSESCTTIFNPARVLPHLFSSVKMDENAGYFSFKPINSGGIVVVKRIGTGPETLVLEPLQVKIVSSKSKPLADSLQPAVSPHKSSKPPSGLDPK